MRRKPKTEYEKLRDKWYKKLEKTGFKDIEQDEDTLKGYASVFAYRHTHDEIVEKQQYFYMAAAFLDQYKFSTERDRIIWEYHANGIDAVAISKTLKAVNIKAGKTTVKDTIQRLKIKMFDLLWAPLKEYHE